ncbi:MAG: lamin tail domain-containing protein [Reichenbachiella sp.]
MIDCMQGEFIVSKKISSLLLFLGFSFSLFGQTLTISEISEPPVIDGVIDASWDAIDFESIDRNNAGTISSQEDLSGKFKMSWDTNNLYLIVLVKDDVFHSDMESNVWNEDGIEIFIDSDNSKNSSFGTNDFQFQLRYADASAYEVSHGDVTGVVSQQVVSNDTIFYEMSIPLSLLDLDGNSIVNGQLLGFDIHINDDDNIDGNREGKLAWYARTDNSSRNPAYFGTANFKQNNQGMIADKPDFSHKRGMYIDPFDLSLNSSHNNATIIYTLDGSDPRFSNSAISVTSPASIMINPESDENRGGKTPVVVVRAVVESLDFSMSEVRTHSFIFVNEVLKQSDPGGHWQEPYANFGWPGLGNPQNIDYDMSPSITENSAYQDLMDDALKAIPSYSLVTDYEDMFGNTKGIFMNALEDGWERPVSVEMIDPNTNDDFQIDAGIRIRGRYSRLPRNGKHSFRLMFRDSYGDKNLEYPIFGDEGTDKFKRLDFRTAQNSSWQTEESHSTVTFLKEVVARDIQGKMGMNYTKSRYCHLYLNGMYWGLFQIQERAEENFAETYLKGDKDDYDIIKPRKNVPVPEEDLKIGAIAGDDQSARRLWDHIIAGVASNEDYFSIQGMNPDGSHNENFERLLDVENLIDYLLISFYVGSLDGPGVTWEGLWGHTVRPNNFIGIYNKVNPDGFKWIVHDFEKTMYSTTESFPLLEQDDTWFSEEFQFLNPITIHRNLMENQEYRIKLADRVFRHYENMGVFTPNQVQDAFDKRKAQIQMAVIAEAARWGNTISWQPENTPQNWENNVSWLFENYIPVRTNIVLGQFEELDLISSLNPPSVIYNGEEVGNYSLVLNRGDQVTLANPSAGIGEIYYSLDESDPRLVGGGLSLNAIQLANNGMITISELGTLKARIKNGDEWSPLLDLNISLDDNLENLKITEIHYNPQDEGLVNGSDLEFLELKNIGDESIDLSQVSISEGIEFQFGNLEIPANQFVVIASDTSAFYNYYGLHADGQYSGQLKNSGELININNSTGRVVISIEYDDDAPWPLSADGLGNSLVAIEMNPSTDPMLASYWRTSTEVGGSPYMDDPESTISPIIINEILANTSNPLVDKIELYNPNGEEVEIGNWFLTDEKDIPSKWQIPTGTVIPANGYLAFENGHYVGDQLEYDANEFGSAFSLSSHGESVYLFSGDANMKLTGYSIGEKYDEVDEGVSIGYYTNSQENNFFIALEKTTFGLENSGPLVGPIIFSEIMYNPAPGFPEFLTVKNMADESINLYSEDNQENTWKIEGVKFQFPLGTSIESEELIYIIQDTVSIETFRSLMGLNAVAKVFNMAGGLDNSGEKLGIYKPGPEYTKDDISQFEYILVEEVRYLDQSPWPIEADGQGASLLRKEGNRFANDPISWETKTILESPILNADGVNTAANNDVELTFNDDLDWRNAVALIKIDGIEMESSEYIINEGMIVLDGVNFSFQKDYYISVEANDYYPAYVVQSILTGPILNSDEDLSNNINVFPNPTSGWLNIELGTSQLNTLVEVNDLSGRNIFKTETVSQNIKVDLQNQLPGVYILSIRNGEVLKTQIIIRE